MGHYIKGLSHSLLPRIMILGPIHALPLSLTSLCFVVEWKDVDMTVAVCNIVTTIVATSGAVTRGVNERENDSHIPWPSVQGMRHNSGSSSLLPRLLAHDHCLTLQVRSLINIRKKGEAQASEQDWKVLFRNMVYTILHKFTRNVT